MTTEFLGELSLKKGLNSYSIVNDRHGPRNNYMVGHNKNRSLILVNISTRHCDDAKKNAHTPKQTDSNQTCSEQESSSWGIHKTSGAHTQMQELLSLLEALTSQLNNWGRKKGCQRNSDWRTRNFPKTHLRATGDRHRNSYFWLRFEVILGYSSSLRFSRIRNDCNLK